jgi:hypothetical protein
LDLRSRYQPVTSTDLARMGLWARQAVIDAVARDAGAVAGDAESLKWTFDRVRDTVGDADAVDARLAELRAAVENKDLAAAATVPQRLSGLLSSADPVDRCRSWLTVMNRVTRGTGSSRER